MAAPNVKNQNTLFRFVSLRNPELTKPKDIEQRFVFHTDNSSGAFFAAMSRRANNQTKWQVLLSAANAFSPYKTEAEIKNDVGNDFYEVAGWVANNRSNIDEQELIQKISGLDFLKKEQEIKIWDNLFYQIVIQKAFYIKEGLMQVLILNNLLKYNNTRKMPEVIEAAGRIETRNIQEPPSVFIIAANARVVLPSALFEEDRISKPPTAPLNNINEQPTGEQRQEALVAAKNSIKALEKAKNEIEGLNKSYQNAYDKAYKEALINYDAAIKPLIDHYNTQLDSAKQALCREPRPENYNPNDYCNQPHIPFPELPPFKFEFAQTVEDLQSKLSEDSFATLQNAGAIGDGKAFEEIIEKADSHIAKQYAIVAENTDFSEPVLLTGGIAIPITSRPLPIEIPVPVETGFIPEKFGIREIGIADYKKVVAHVCCYDAGEVAHIENIMAKELRSKTTTRERIEEITQTTETQQETENLTDSTSSERFEMQSEVSKLLQEQRQFDAHANFSASWKSGGSYSLDVGANYATNTSKEESNRQAVTQAKEVTQRAMERIVTKFRTELVKKTTERFKEENVHAFDNRLGEHHVSGVYRFINAIYKNQVYNYGKRMMYEFMIPQPSKLHRLGMLENQGTVVTTTVVEKPIDPRTIGLVDSSYLNEYNYKTWIAKYGASAKAFPQREIFVGKSFNYNSNTASTAYTQAAAIDIPEHYLTNMAQVNFTGMEALGPWDRKVITSVGNISRISAPNRIELTDFFYIRQYKNTLPVSMSCTSYVTCTVTINVSCLISSEAINQWQQETYDAIIKAYQEKLAAYNDALAQNQTSADASLGTNPGFYRDIEQLVLRKNCISYLMDETKMGQGFYTGTTLKTFALQQTQAMDNYASFAKFMEQAFEWNLISYNFYPFYWGKRDNWPELYQYDCNDPLFRSFMQAGLARVVVTVKPGFENAVMHYMVTGQIWNGGQVPVLDNPLYLSIVDELKEQEYVVEDTWETVVPTSLIALQNSGVAIDASGLPCGDDCNEHAGNGLVANNNVIMGK